MKRSLSAILLATTVLALPVVSAWAQAEAMAVAEEQQPLDPNILDAKKIFILNTVMDFSLASAFTSEIMDWERFEVVFSEDEADLCFALSAEADYQKQEIPTGETDDAGLRPRAIGTMRTLDKLYLKIFVPGGDDLWQDEAEVGDDSEAAVDLVRHLRERIEEEEAKGTEADDSR